LALKYERDFGDSLKCSEIYNKQDIFDAIFILYRAMKNIKEDTDEFTEEYLNLIY
jgi:hypothetical protein